MHTSSFRAVIFDVDGTLLDTLEDIAVGTNYALTRAGFPVHPPDAYRRFVGNGVETLLRRAAPPDFSSRLPDKDGKGGEPEAARVFTRLLTDLADYHKTGEGDATRPFPEIPELLAALVKRGVKLGVLSNKPQNRVEHSIPLFFPDIPFVRIQGATPEYPLKPAPAAVLAVLAGAGLSSHETVYLGDSDVDMQTARNAGMYAAGAGWGYRGERELTSAGADRVFSHPLELLEIL